MNPTLVIGLVAAGVGGLCIIALVVAAGTRLVSSALDADAHLFRGMSLTPRSRLGPIPGEPARAILGRSVAPLDRYATQPTNLSPADDDGSQQIFAQLNEYYAANINAGNMIFWATLLSMSIGFALIFTAVIIAAFTPKNGNETTAIVATIAGILSQFIAATFLVALRSTQQQSTSFAQTLVDLRLRDMRTAVDARSVTLGLALLDQITGDGADALANQTRAALAMGLIIKAAPPPAASATPPAADVDAPDRLDQRLDRTASQSSSAKSVAYDSGQPVVSREQQAAEQRNSNRVPK